MGRRVEGCDEGFPVYHRSTLSGVGASDKPGAVQLASRSKNCSELFIDSSTELIDVTLIAEAGLTENHGPSRQALSDTDL